MPDFVTLYTEYENVRNRDICSFCADHAENDAATRFLLVRSLDKNNLKDILSQYSGGTTDGNIISLAERAYSSSVTIQQLIAYIEGQRAELIRQREAELVLLDEVLANFPIVNCGVRNDKVDDIIKSFVRNKSLKSKDALTAELDHVVLPRIRQYSLWSYYNQTANDIVELFFLRHEAVIPTLRKIPDVDFFLKVGHRIIPFDLKFTHISDSYFDLASQGIIRDPEARHHDDFYVCGNPNESESWVIKAYYSAYKRAHKAANLPNLRGLDKNTLCELLTATGDAEAIRFVSGVKQRHARYVPTTPELLHSLEWWNYKYQGERRFCNNNRLFVFLAYTNKFVDGRELKGKTAEIGRRIGELLDHLTEESIHTVKYHYDKDPGLAGDYTALSLSTIYYE